MRYQGKTTVSSLLWFVNFVGGSVLLLSFFGSSIQLRSLSGHGTKIFFINLTSKQGTVNVSMFRQGSKLNSANQFTENALSLGTCVCPTQKMLETIHPLVWVKQANRCQVVGHGTDFLSKKGCNWWNWLLHINTISFQFFDAFGQKFVVMNQGPQISLDAEWTRQTKCKVSLDVPSSMKRSDTWEG